MDSAGPGSSHAQLSEDVIAHVCALFPDISLEYLNKLASDHHDVEALVNEIMEQADKGNNYPRQPEQAKLKRKRDRRSNELQLDEELSNLKLLYDNPERRNKRTSRTEVSNCADILSLEFPRLPASAIANGLAYNSFLLLPTYLWLEERIASWEHLEPKPWTMLPDAPVDQSRRQAKVDKLRKQSHDRARKSGWNLFEELDAAKRIRDARKRNKVGEVLEQSDEPQSTIDSLQGPQDGTAECQCCFDDIPIGEMVHCDGEDVHFFCVTCARRNAETAVGLSKYELECMSTDKCGGGFALQQRHRFLDDKLTAALDRIESETVLRLAGIENLVYCPFCDYAEECLPVEMDKEFRCRNEDCGIVSCRLCRAETHIPKTCEEIARETGHSARRGIEEAMSAAMIRKCNKCKTPFVKDIGCNKMTCPTPQCRNTQCYICSASCDYSHFNDQRRGGKAGNCPLWDDAEKRHQNEVSKAEEQARKAVTEQQPDVNPELLRIDMSKAVAGGGEQRGKPKPQERIGVADRNGDDLWQRRMEAGMRRGGLFEHFEQALAAQRLGHDQRADAVIPQQDGAAPGNDVAGPAENAAIPGGHKNFWKHKVDEAVLRGETPKGKAPIRALPANPPLPALPVRHAQGARPRYPAAFPPFIPWARPFVLGRDGMDDAMADLESFHRELRGSQGANDAAGHLPAGNLNDEARPRQTVHDRPQSKLQQQATGQWTGRLRNKVGQDHAKQPVENSGQNASQNASRNAGQHGTQQQHQNPATGESQLQPQEQAQARPQPHMQGRMFGQALNPQMQQSMFGHAPKPSNRDYLKRARSFLNERILHQQRLRPFLDAMEPQWAELAPLNLAPGSRETPGGVEQDASHNRDNLRMGLRNAMPPGQVPALGQVPAMGQRPAVGQIPAMLPNLRGPSMAVRGQHIYHHRNELPFPLPPDREPRDNPPA